MKIRAIINVKVGSPLIPRNVKDPSGQFGNLRNANAQLVKRYASIKKGIRALISSFSPVIVTNAAVYEYQLDAQRYNSINLFLQQLLYDDLLDNQQGAFTNRWWLNANLTSAYTDGTSDALQSAKNIAVVDIVGQEISQQVRSTQLEQIVFSQGFQSRVGLVQSRVFESMKGLSDSTKTDLANTLARSMSSGKGIKETTKDVLKRVDVSHSRAKRIVRTEILNAYRTATAAETEVLNEDVYADSEYHMLQLWWSALAPTSRPNHIIRHGETFTTQEVREFYTLAANAINCLCSQSPVLANKKTGEILQKPLQERMRKAKRTYQASHGLVKKKAA